MSDGYSTSDIEKIKKIQEGAEPVDLARSMVNQGILDDAERRSGFGRMTGPITAVSQAVGLGADI